MWSGVDSTALTSPMKPMGSLFGHVEGDETVAGAGYEVFRQRGVEDEVVVILAAQQVRQQFARQLRHARLQPVGRSL